MKCISSDCFEPLTPQGSVSDEAFVNSIASHVETCAHNTIKSSVMYLETAGGRRRL